MNNGPMPNMEQKYTKEEREKFAPIRKALDSGTPNGKQEATLLMRKLGAEFQRFKEYYDDVKIIQRNHEQLIKKENDHRARASEYQARGAQHQARAAEHQARADASDAGVQALERREKGLVRQLNNLERQGQRIDREIADLKAEKREIMNSGANDVAKRLGQVTITPRRKIGSGC